MLWPNFIYFFAVNLNYLHSIYSKYLPFLESFNGGEEVGVGVGVRMTHRLK